MFWLGILCIGYILLCGVLLLAAVIVGGRTHLVEKP